MFSFIKSRRCLHRRLFFFVSDLDLMGYRGRLKIGIETAVLPKNRSAGGQIWKKLL